MRTYKTALVTGASSGIGRGLAAGLAAGGTNVVIAARRVAELETLAAEIARAGGQARVQAMDVADTPETVRTIRRLDEELGGLDLVIANAGVGADLSKTARFTWEGMERALHINFCGAAATLTAALPAMVTRGRGHIVGTSSLAGFTPLPGGAGYSATKAGLNMLLECLRLDLAGTGVAATAICPGFIKTAMTEKSRHPLPMLMECDDAVALILRELPHAPAEIAFPRPMAAAARLGGRLPRRLRDAILTRLRDVDRA